VRLGGDFAGGDLDLDIRSWRRRRLSTMLRAHRMVRSTSL